MLFNCCNGRMMVLWHFFIALYSFFHLLTFQATFSAFWVIRTQIYTHLLHFFPYCYTCFMDRIIYRGRWRVWLDLQRYMTLCVLAIPSVLLAQKFFKWIILKFLPCMWFFFSFLLFGWLPRSKTGRTAFQSSLIIQSARVELGFLNFKMNFLRFPNWKHIQKAVLRMVTASVLLRRKGRKRKKEKINK